MFCAHTRKVAGVMHCCELEAGHIGDHMYALTTGQLKALEYALDHPPKPTFPAEAFLLIFGAAGIEVFIGHHSGLDWAATCVMLATAIRWLKQWLNER